MSCFIYDFVGILFIYGISLLDYGYILYSLLGYVDIS